MSLQQVVHSGGTGESGVTKLQLLPEAKMNIHKNARLTPFGREEMTRQFMEGGESVAKVARDFHVFSMMVREWVERRRKSGP
jgi:transposase-like protein